MSVEQRTNIKFFVKLGKTPTETLDLLKAVFGEQAMSRTRVFEWHKRFSTGREDVDDDPRPERPSTSRIEANIEKVKERIIKRGKEIISKHSIIIGTRALMLHQTPLIILMIVKRKMRNSQLTN